MQLHGKRVVVTGSGGGGCGRAIARRVAREGASVVVSDINEEGGRETVRQILDSGGKASFFRADIRKEKQAHELLEYCVGIFGGVEILVNNASGPEFRPDEPLEQWKAIVETELLGTMYTTRKAIDLMQGNGGAIVNVSSISALPHGRKRAAPGYDAAKAGVLRLTTMLAFLGEQDKIRVNCLAPGWIAAPQVRAFWDPLTPEQRQVYGAPSRLLSLEEVADAVLRLATDESLFGRVLVWWSEDQPRLIPWGDRGYEHLV